MNLLPRFLCIPVLCTILFTTSSWAAGLWLYEQGTPDLGTAAAGRAARANDASTAGNNPAGMTRLDRSQMLAAFQGMIFESEFNLDSATFSGGNGGDAGDFIESGSFHYVQSLSEKWKLGISAASYFGLGVDYDDDWAGRYYVQEADLITYGINPGVGYKVNNWLSVGAGFSIAYAELEQKSAINNATAEGDPTFPDGRIKLKDDDVGYGFNLGMLFEPQAGTRFGITYRSEVELEFKDVASISGLGPTLTAALDNLGLLGSKIDIDMNIPQAVMLSGYHQFTGKLALMANIGWQEWSEFGKSDITVRSTTTTKFTQDRDWNDAWHFALGAQYRIADPWLLSVGFAYDTDPVDNAENNTPDLALDRQIRYAAGLQYDWSADITVGVAYEFLDLGDANVNLKGGPLQGDLKGDYDPNHIHFIAVNLIWKF
jgi:long-chain fatty acid transport protein